MHNGLLLTGTGTDIGCVLFVLVPRYVSSTQKISVIIHPQSSQQHIKSQSDYDYVKLYYDLIINNKEWKMIHS